MSDIPQFSTTQKEFIRAALLAEAPIPKIIDDLTEIYPFGKDKETRTTLSERITKIKSRMPEQEKKAAWVSIPHYLSAHWRLSYFRALLSQTDEVSVKIRLLGEIRKEVKLLDDQTLAGERERKAAYEEEMDRQMDESVPIENPQYESDVDAWIRDDWKHSDTSLPTKPYDRLDDDTYARREDGVVVNGDGIPKIVGEKTHMEWIAEQKQKGLYIYDPKTDAEVIPSPLVLDKDHKKAYLHACEKGWILNGTILPKNAYSKITCDTSLPIEYCDKQAQYRRATDGVVVDNLGIPFVKGDKDHHTWLYEFEGLYNYDPKESNNTPDIKTVLAETDTSTIPMA